MKKFYFRSKDKTTNKIIEFSIIAKNIFEAEEKILKYHKNIIPLEFNGWTEAAANENK